MFFFNFISEYNNILCSWASENHENVIILTKMQQNHPKTECSKIKHSNTESTKLRFNIGEKSNTVYCYPSQTRRKTNILCITAMQK